MGFITKRDRKNNTQEISSIDNMASSKEKRISNENLEQPLDKVDTKAYQIAIENLALTRSPLEFDNEGPIHASIVFGNIFKTANDYVKIYAGNFDGAVSDQDYYISNLKSVLKRRIPVTVIFQNKPNEHSIALSKLKEFPNNENISIRVLSKHQKVFTNHFTIADHRMYRLETSTTNFEAECSFNNLKTTKQLYDVFSYLLTISKPYKVT